MWESVDKDGRAVHALVARCLSKDSDCAGLKCLYAGGDCDPFFDVHNPVHSDFLVHWTGRDIDDKYDPNWEQRNDPRLNLKIIEPYVERLKNILKYGLWMTNSSNDQPLIYKGKTVNRAPFARTCFTELKLSDARVHAKRFGRLGIGVKRPFVLDKRGSPMIYFRREFGNWFFVTFERNGKIELPSDAWWTYYLKSMNEGKTSEGYVQYANFNESEWRVIYSPQIEKQFGKPCGVDGFSINKYKEFCSYFKKYEVPECKKPQYLLRLDKWFAIIIYPTLAVKVFAEADTDVKELIEAIKPEKPKEAHVTESAKYEKYSKPFGINIDACRNF